MPPFALAWVVGALSGVSVAVGTGLSYIAVLASAQDDDVPVVLLAVFVLLLVGTEVGDISWIAVPAMVGASVRSFGQSPWAAEHPAVLLLVVEVPFASPSVVKLEMFSWLAVPASVETPLLWVEILDVVVSCVAVPASALADVLRIVFSDVFVPVVIRTEMGVAAEVTVASVVGAPGLGPEVS
ncbi:MAG: hypothetical protein KVP17_003730 [Porospora cf. gigantea B]|uniref:uncharacterized protein n=1 Tax=Porospora cf. gigantea B TaxID=2853592 RepID=UPI0035717A99|nr:MAG: hypothetical protein KVP17_003730 [Porospora cf. gigantea B]